MSRRFTDRARIASRLLAWAIAFTTATTAASVARAEPSAADIDTARSLYKEGLALRKSGDEAGALQKFQGAFALTKSPVMGLEVAKSEVALGKLVEAREQALDVDALAVSSKETKASADARAEAKSLASDLVQRIPSLKIRLVDVPAGAKPQVTVDGAPVPFEVLGEARAVDPGTHVVAASIGAEPPVTIEATVAEGESRDVTLSLAGHAAPTTDAKPATMAPLTSATPGAPSDSPSHTGALVWIGAGLAGVGVVVGSVTGVMALSKASTVKDECPGSRCPSSASSDLDAVKTRATISTIGFVAAGAGVALIVVGLVTAPSTPSPQSTGATGASFTPWIGLGSAGVSGAF